MKIFASVALVAFASLASAQTAPLIVNSRIKLPENSAESDRLVSSLGKLLGSLQTDIEKNEWIYQPQLLQTAILIDEIRDAPKAKEGESPLHRQAHLSNVIPLDDDRFFLQVAYFAKEKDVPVLLSSVELIAHRTKDGYRFSAPLARNTKHWKTQRMGNMTFHYRGEINLAKAKEYHGLVTAFDMRLDSAPEEMALYFFEDDLEAQQALGLPYKLEYNGDSGSMGFGVRLKSQEIYLVNGTKFLGFDPHDLWHNRLSKVKPRKEVNHAVDEGIATLYGGSWGLTWNEMFAAFQAKIDVSEGTDWLDLRKRKVCFDTKGHDNPTDFMINALFVKKIEREKGFAGVWDLLNAKDKEAYFRTLTRLTGIDKGNYNAQVWQLLKQEIQEQNG